MSYSWDRIFNLVSLDNGAKMSPKRRAFLSLVFGISSSFGKTKNKCYQQLKHLQPLLWVGEDFLQGCICSLVECCIYCQLSSQIIWSTEDCTIFIYMRRMLKLFSMLSKILIKPNWIWFYRTSWKVESPLRKVWISDVSSVSPSSERIRNSLWRGVSSWKWVSFQTFQGGNSTFISSFDKTNFSCFTLSHRRSSTVSLETRILLISSLFNLTYVILKFLCNIAQEREESGGTNVPRLKYYGLADLWNASKNS